MDRQKSFKLLMTAGALIVSLTHGAGFAAGWGGSYNQTSGGSSSGTSLNLNLTIADCTKCHTGSNPDRHHSLISKLGKQCLDCHQMTADAFGQYTVQVVRDCLVCHKSSEHDSVKHNITTCSSCHGSDVLRIHSGWGYSSSSGVSICYKCHTSTTPAVQKTIATGVSGQSVSCTGCHGSNPHSWGRF